MASLKDFEIINKLGEGSFGQVYKVRRKADKILYVMKQINISKMNPRMKNEALNEVTILSKLDNQYIVKYYDSFIDKTLLCIVMEYCEQGDLHRYLKGQMGRPLPENLMCSGIAYLHKNKILHRDIKTMNVFLCREQWIRIGDLGVAKALGDQNNFARTMVGTPYYLSPEMCEEKPYNEKSDIWALGCVLYELCTYKHPFEANNQGALVLKIIRGKYEQVSNKLYSPALTNIISLCLQTDYKLRPTAYDILQMQTLVQIAKSQSMALNLNQPHPLSNSYKSSQQIQLEKVPEKSKALPSSNQETPKVLLVKGTAAQPIQLQAAQKPIFDREAPVRQSAPLNQIQGAPKEARSESETPQPSQKNLNQQPVLQPPKIKSSAFQVNQPKPYPQSQASNQAINPLNQQSAEYQNMYKEWKEKVQEINKPVQQQQQSQDQIKTISNKQAIQPTKKPNPIRVSSAYNTPQISKPKVDQAKPETEQKKRVRKGAPQEQARKAQQPIKLKQPQQIQDQSEADSARDKLKLLKNKNKPKGKNLENKDDEWQEIRNLPDKIVQEKKQNQSQDKITINKPIIQEQVDDIDNFFNDQIQRIRQIVKEENDQAVKKVENDQTAKSTQIKSETDMTEHREDISEIKQEGGIPVMEVENTEDYYDEHEQNTQPKDELITFDEDEDQDQENQEQQDQGNISDQEAYSNNENEEEQEHQEDQEDQEFYEEEIHQQNEQKDETNDQLFNQFSTIKEDPQEQFEETKFNPQEEEQLKQITNEDHEDYQQEVMLDDVKIELKKKILEREKRKVELQMLMQAKVRECVRELGQNRFNDVVDFFRKKLNSDNDLDEQDQEEIDDIIQNKFKNQRNPQIIYTIYQILHFEIEIEKCNEKIQELQLKYESE